MTCNKSKTVLILAPLPPPTDGQSKISKRVNDTLITGGVRTIVINMNRRTLKRSVKEQMYRIYRIIILLCSIYYYRNKTDEIYISLSESTLGNAKDIIVYLILIGNLEKISLHMLGGTGMDRILNRTRLQSMINGYFLKKIRRVIVEGNRGNDIFRKYIESDRIVTLYNCVEDYLFAEYHQIQEKFRKSDTVQILYLSNMILEKGYLNVVEAFTQLPDNIRSELKLVFVGGFQSKNDEQYFRKRIQGYSNIEYLGKFIDGDDKYRLYCRSHIFCLPTYYPYEGQPISILEAYSTGCVVITTNHAGIPDIFSDEKNGFTVETNNVQSLYSVFKKIVFDRGNLEEIALRNWSEAFDKYHPERFDKEVLEIFRA